MSTVFRVWCDLHEVLGPKIKRSAGGMSLLDAEQHRIGASMPWAEFLIEHEFCGQLELHREGSEGHANRLRATAQ